jgi:hypothetical protein
MQFQGSLEELQVLVEGLGQPGHWVHSGAFEMFVIEDGISNLRLNWWPDSGALMLVGDPAQRQAYREALEKALADRSPGG